jgi:hypothetical protein
LKIADKTEEQNAQEKKKQDVHDFAGLDIPVPLLARGSFTIHNESQESTINRVGFKDRVIDYSKNEQ